MSEEHSNSEGAANQNSFIMWKWYIQESAKELISGSSVLHT